MGKLADAIGKWIRAEYQFRLGPNAYHGETQRWLIEAEEELRETLTGEPGLLKAAKELGVKHRFKRGEEETKPGARVRIVEEGETPKRVKVVESPKPSNILLPKSPGKPRGLFGD